MLLKRRIQILLVLLCITAALVGVGKLWLNWSLCKLSWSGDLPATKQKLDLGADPNATSYGLSALAGAIWYRHRPIAVLLLRRGADPNLAVPLVFGSGDPELIALMMTHGLSIQGKEGTNALHVAIFAGKADIVAFLLQHGVDPNARDADTGKTPLQEAHEGWALQQHDSPRILALLRAAGAK